MEMNWEKLMEKLKVTLMVHSTGGQMVLEMVSKLKASLVCPSAALMAMQKAQTNLV